MAKESKDIVMGSGGNGRQGDNKTVNSFEKDFGVVNFSDVDRILQAPGIEDMAGVSQRGNWKNDEVRIAWVKLVRRLSKFGLKSRLEFMRLAALSTNGVKGFGKTLQLQTTTNMVIPSVIREQISLDKVRGKDKDEAVKSSDFRKETEDREVKGEKE